MKTGIRNLAGRVAGALDTHARTEGASLSVQLAAALMSPLVRGGLVSEVKGYPWQSTVHNWLTIESVGGKADYSKPFRNHPQVFRAISVIANATGSVDFKLARRSKGGKNTDVTTGIEYEALQRPSSYLSSDMFFAQVAGWLQMACGECFIRIIREGSARRLVFLSPDCIKIDVKNDVLVYEYHQPNMAGVEIIPEEDLIHIKTPFNPYDPMRGIGPLQAAATPYRDDLDVRKYNSAVVRAGGMPAGFLMMKGGQWPTKEEHEQFSEELKKVGERQQKAILTGDGTWQQAGQTPEEMAFIELRKLSFKEIGGVFGVPPQMLGDYERDQADAMVQMLSFHVDTMRSIYRLISDVLTLNLWKIRGTSSLLGQDLFCAFDDSQVPAIVELTQRLRQSDIAELDAGLATINDVLERRGQEPKTWGSVWWPQGIRIPISGPEMPEGFAPAPPPTEDDDQEDAAVDRLERRSLKLTAIPFEQQIIKAIEDIWDEVEREVIARVKTGKAFELVPSNGDGNRFRATFLTEDELLRSDESIKDPFNIAEIAGKVASRTTPILRHSQFAGGTRGLKLARRQGTRFKVDAKPAIAQLSRQVQRFAVPVTETTWTKVKDTLALGLKNGEPEAKLVARVQQAMDVRRAQAANTAVTEVNAALNGGVYLGFLQSDVVLEERWLKGSNARPDHAKAHGQTVKIGQAFLVGGERLYYPGDPNGSAAQVCNCNCTIVPARIRG